MDVGDYVVLCTGREECVRVLAASLRIRAVASYTMRSSEVLTVDSSGGQSVHVCHGFFLKCMHMCLLRKYFFRPPMVMRRSYDKRGANSEGMVHRSSSKPWKVRNGACARSA